MPAKKIPLRAGKPKASRPHAPGYGLPAGNKGLLPWSWAEQRLKKSHNYWITTVTVSYTHLAHKLVRMQARPKILLSSNFEDAAQVVQEYREYLIGLVSDVEFPWEGKLSPEAGFELARLMKALVPDVPVVLQTSRTEFRPRALAAGYSFLRKRSPTLLKDLRRILTEQVGFEMCIRDSFPNLWCL